MENYIFLKRIGKNTEHYLLKILDLDTSICKYAIYDRYTNVVLDEIVKLETIKDFVDYNTKKPLKDIDITPVKIDISHLSILKFDQNKPRLREITYSFKYSNGSLFVPCCGKNDDNESFKKWGKYIDNYHLTKDIRIEGYDVFNIDLFDRYVIKYDIKDLCIDFTNNKDILIKEFKDYLQDLSKMFKNPLSITVTTCEGKEIKVEI